MWRCPPSAPPSDTASAWCSFVDLRRPPTEKYMRHRIHPASPIPSPLSLSLSLLPFFLLPLLRHAEAARRPQFLTHNPYYSVEHSLHHAIL